MTYNDAKNLLGSANYIYIDVTDEEVADIAIAHYDTSLDGTRLFGTLEPVEALASKELRAGSVSFG